MVLTVGVATGAAICQLTFAVLDRLLDRWSRGVAERWRREDAERGRR